MLIPTSALQQRSSDKMNLFHSTLSSVTLEPGQPTAIPLRFIPVRMEPRHCAVVLSNERLGELVLSVTASVRLPYPTLPRSSFHHSGTFLNEQTKTLHLQACAGEVVQEQLVIHSKNSAFEDAVLEISKWGMSNSELKRRLLSQSLNYAALTTAIANLTLVDHLATRNDNLPEQSDCLELSVETNDPHFKCPLAVSVPAHSNGSAVLPVEFLAKEEGQYECHLVLHSQHDTRLYVIESTVMSQEKSTELEFETPAMQPLTQEIPLVSCLSHTVV